MPFVRYLPSSLRYQSYISHQMRTPTFPAGHRINALRSFVTTPAKRGESGTGACISIDKFHALDKSVARLDVKVDNVQSSVRELGTKANKLLFLIVGAVILKAGFDLYRDERNWKRGHKE